MPDSGFITGTSTLISDKLMLYLEQSSIPETLKKNEIIREDKDIENFIAGMWSRYGY
jgi:hypothetical protein